MQLNNGWIDFRKIIRQNGSISIDNDLTYFADVTLKKMSQKITLGE